MQCIDNFWINLFFFIIRISLLLYKIYWFFFQMMMFCLNFFYWFHFFYFLLLWDEVIRLPLSNRNRLYFSCCRASNLLFKWRTVRISKWRNMLIGRRIGIAYIRNLPFSWFLFTNNKKEMQKLCQMEYWVIIMHWNCWLIFHYKRIKNNRNDFNAT